MSYDSARTWIDASARVHATVKLANYCTNYFAAERSRFFLSPPFTSWLYRVAHRKV